MSAKPSSPLGEAGSELWRRIAKAYTLRPDELSTLEDVCEMTDMIAALSNAWVDAGKPLTTKGSMGQQVTHPLISEIRAHRMSRNALWRQLKLPDAGAAAESRSTQARSAAQSRWASVHGAGA